MDTSECECKQCLRDREEGHYIGCIFFPQERLQMVLCSKCGNKRCPHAENHKYLCTNSNEPNQPRVTPKEPAL